MDRRNFVLVHGAGGGAWEWVVWQRVLAARGATVRAPDLEPARAGLAATTLDDYAAQVEAVVRECARPPVLVGASLGGLLAVMVAARCPLAALVLVNPMPPAPWHAALPPQPPSSAVIPWARTASLAGTRRALPDASDATCEWAWRRWRDEAGAVVDAARAGVAVMRPACPVLMLASEADEDVPAAITAAFAAGWEASLWRLPGASHVGPLLGRGAARCAEQVAAWVASLPEP
jgi:pimeloyl-ACP methyl ester carboxylesterase